jgi:hypothetical protein
MRSRPRDHNRDLRYLRRVDELKFENTCTFRPPRGDEDSSLFLPNTELKVSNEILSM